MQHRWLARVLVVALHLALLAVLLQQQAPLAPDTGERRSVSMRIILPTPPRPQPLPRSAAPERSAPRPPAAPAPQPAATADTPATTTPLPTSPAPPAAPAAPPPSGAEQPRTALRLTLPPGYAASSAAARNPALSDPRSNTPKPTLEDKIADATGGAGAWVEERVDNHSQSIGAQGEYRTVMRRGNTCVEIFRSRISDNNAFNSSVAPSTISMVGRPYPCK